jgi:hypothetical protein
MAVSPEQSWPQRRTRRSEQAFLAPAEGKVEVMAPDASPELAVRRLLVPSTTAVAFFAYSATALIAAEIGQRLA